MGQDAKARWAFASDDPQPIALGRVGLTGAHLESYGDEPGAPEVTEANRETPVKYRKGIKGLPMAHCAACPAVTHSWPLASPDRSGQSTGVVRDTYGLHDFNNDKSACWRVQ